MDDAQTRALFESMSTDDLLALRTAHEIDNAFATTPESIAFGASRLGLIAEVLKSREVSQ